MNREEELASLLSEIGLERGVGIEQLAGELARLSLPTFIDTQVFRSAVLNAVEYQLHAQLEATMDDLRRRFGERTSTNVAPPSPRPAVMPRPSRLQSDPSRPQPIVSSQELVSRPTELATPPAEPELPSDATVLWMPGQEPSRG